MGLENLPEADQTEVLLGIGRIIQQNIILRVINELQEKDKDEFDKLLEEKPDDQEAILNFLKSKILGLDGIVEEEIKNFKEKSADLMKKITG